MFKLVVKAHFDAAHRLPDYKGKCERIHGHTWHIEAEVAGRELGDNGMVCDFFDLRRILNDAIGPLDHAYINEIKPFDNTAPTSENLAYFIFTSIKSKIELLDKAIKLLSVTVHESPEAAAVYTEEEDDE